MADINIGDVTARIRADTTDFVKGIRDAQGQLTALGQQMAQSRQQLSQLPFNAVQNALDSFTQSVARAGNNQTLLRQSLAQADQAMKQFGVTTDQTGAMVDKFGQQVSQAGQQQLKDFTTSIRETQAELVQLQRFGINSSAGGGGLAGLLGGALPLAAGVGLATTITGLVSALKNFVGESVSLAAKMQDLNMAFRAIDGSAAAANKTLAFLFETAQRVGVDFEKVVEGFKRFDQAAKGTILEGEGIRQVFENMLSGARALGLSSQQVSGALVALEQTLTKGRLSAEEYRRQLGNAVPGALKLMADGIGVTTQALEEMITSGLIPADAAVIAFTNSMGELGRKAGPTVERLSGTFAQLRNETTTWMTAIGQGLGTIIQPFLADLIKMSIVLRDLFNIKPPGTQALPQVGSPQAPMGVVGSPFTDLITRAATQNAIDPGLFSRLIQAESNFNPNAVSRAGALGLGQLMLPTAQGLQIGVTAQNLREPERNVQLAARYLADMIDMFRQFDDQIKLALAAYNAGPGNVQKALNATRQAGEPLTFANVLPRLPMPGETGPYVERILAGGTTSASAVAGGAAGAPAVPPSAIGATPAMAGALSVSDAFVKNIEKTLTDFPRLQQQIENVAKSSMNWGNILGEDVHKQADALVKKFVQTAELLARFPDLLAKMTPQQREQVELAGRRVAIIQQRLDELAPTESGYRERIQQLKALEEAQKQADEEVTKNAEHYHDAIEQVRKALEQQEQQALQTLNRLQAGYTQTKEARDADTASAIAAKVAWSDAVQTQAALVKHLADTRDAYTQEVTALRDRFGVVKANIDATRDAAEAETAYTTKLQNALDLLRTPREQRQSERLALQRPAVERTPEQEQLLQQIRAQERLNYIIGVSEQLANSVGSAWTNALNGIAQGTQTVGRAFQQMAQTILQSMAQIAAQEATKGLIRLIVGSLLGGSTGVMGGGGSLGGAATSGFISSLGGGGDIASAIAGGGIGNAFATTGSFAGGGIVRRPTLALIGENAATTPEYVLNRPQMQALMTRTLQAAPSAGGQGMGGNHISIINVGSREQGEAEAAKQRALGRSVIINEVMSEMAQGDRSQILKLMRLTSR